MKVEYQTNSAGEPTWVCRILRTTQDVEGADHMVVLRPQGLLDEIQANLLFFVEYIKKSEGRDVRACFHLHIADVRPSQKQEKTAHQEGEAYMRFRGNILKLNKEENSFFLSSSFNLEVSYENKEKCRGFQQGDWVEAVGELLCSWDEEDILPIE